jgi:DNA-directed RNA polymerase specialized sigma24 family protein
MSDEQPPSHRDARFDKWTTLHETGKALLPGMLRYLGVPENDLEDLLQEVLIAAFTSLDRYDPERFAAVRCDAGLARGGPSGGETEPSSGAAAGDAPEPLWLADAAAERQAAAKWLFGIAWRQVSHHLGRAYGRREVPIGLRSGACFEGVATLPGGDAHVEMRQRRELTLELLGAVAPWRRVVVILHDGYELPLREIAELLGINANTAGSWLSRGRGELRAAVKRLRPEKRQALRGCWVLLPPSAVSDLFGEGADTTAHGTSAMHEITGSTPRSFLSFRPAPFHLHAMVRPMVAGIVGAAALVLAVERPVPRARCFGEAVADVVVVHRKAGVEAEPIEGDTPAGLAVPGREEAARGREEAASGREEIAPGREERGARPTPAGGDRDTLAEERRLLAGVLEASARGEHVLALERLAAHTKRFPKGRLSSVREAVRASVLAAASRRSRALREGSER